MPKCKKCGTNVGFLISLCDSCKEAEKLKNDEEYSKWSQSCEELNRKRELADAERALADAEHEMKIKQCILTTAPQIEGYRVIENIEIISAECVYGINIFRDMFADMTNVFGGRSKSSQKVLRDARKTCLSELAKEGVEVGANAVIAVHLDYNEFSGGGKSMIFLVASGTAVRIEPL